jgi:uncharacterized OsmC-like protein
VLEARQIDASNGKLISEVTGEIEVDCGVLVIRHIHAHYKLQASRSQLETIKRVYKMHADRCPVARSLKGSIVVTTSLELVS